MSSEVARLRRQIEEEYEAAQRALYGFAEGTARHQIINARMARVGGYVDDLAALVGIEKAAAILVETMEGSALPQSSPNTQSSGGASHVR